jgi:hypothetical protein
MRTDVLAEGGVRIFLLQPFRHESKLIKSVTLAPVTWDNTLRWNDGEYDKATDLLFELVQEGAVVLRKLRYPDVDRVMTQFFSMLPPEIRDAIASGQIPRRVSVASLTDEELKTGTAEPEVPSAESPEVPSEEDGNEPPLTPEEQWVRDAPDPHRTPSPDEVRDDMAAHPVPPEFLGPDPVPVPRTRQTPPPVENTMGFDLGPH